MSTHRFGWLPDIPDQRDMPFKTTFRKKLPASVDLRDICPAPYQQGDLGSCVAQSVSACMQIVSRVQGQLAWAQVIPSRLFVYYNARKIDGAVDYDAGTYLRSGIKGVVKYGACKEVPTWAYDITQFATKPTKVAYKEGLTHQALKYSRLGQSINAMKQCLAEGFPFVCGISIYESFLSEEVEKTGVIPMPGRNERVEGGHAITIVGYDAKSFILRNSWGEEWGQKGYATIPHEYLVNDDMAADFWTIRLVE